MSPKPTKINKQTEPLRRYVQKVLDEDLPFSISTNRPRYIRDRFCHIMKLVKEEMDVWGAPIQFIVTEVTDGFVFVGRSHNEIKSNLQRLKKCQEDEPPKEKPLIYLASPYSHESELVQYHRYEQVLGIAKEMIVKGHLVFSPIIHSYYIAMECPDIKQGFEGWKEFDLRILAKCDKLLVVQMDGWEESKGIKEEIKEAQRLGIEIDFLKVNIKTY
jgi:hypothetical protein